jgi:hypothetical protein
MRKAVWSPFLLGMLLVLSFLSNAGADATPLANNRHIFLNVANEAGVKYDRDGAYYGGPGNTYYMKADGGGLNSNFIAPDSATTKSGGLTTKTMLPFEGNTVSGSVYLNDEGGRGFSDDIILLLSMQGPIADNFSVNIKSSGYSWTPASAGIYNPMKPTTEATGAVGSVDPLIGLPIQGVGLIYQPVALDETFTKAAFAYGPQMAKPGPGGDAITPLWSLPFYPGQSVSDPSSVQYLMFIDLKAGAMRNASLVDNGSVKVDYSFNNVYGDVAFNMYAWVTAANQGEGISFTNPATNGYLVSYTGAPVAGVTYSTPGPYQAGNEVVITAEFSKDLADAPVPMITLTGAEVLTSNMTKIDARHYSYSYTAGSGNGAVDVSFTGTDLATSNQLTYNPISGASFVLAPPLAVAVDGSLIINGSAAITRSSSATLALTATSNAGAIAQMQFSKDGVNYFPFEPFAATRAVTLLPGDGLKTMYVRFKDAAGNVSAPITASISLDTTAPNGGSIINNGGAAFTSSKSATLQLTADADVTQMQFSKDGVHYFPFEPFAATRVVTLSPGDGLKTTYVRFKDAAGNVSAPISAGITLDMTPPSGTIAFTTPNPVTSALGTLALTATDTASGVIQMQFSKNGSGYYAWEPFASTRTVTLAPGLNTLTVRFKDAAGNLSAPVSTTITRN